MWNCSYTWKIYAEKLLTLSAVYGFWKYVSKLHRREAQRYLEMFYTLKFRELVRLDLLYILMESQHMPIFLLLGDLVYVRVAILMTCTVCNYGGR